ncbi:N-glycanase [Lutimonas saemankumensis]|uniref:PNGase F N-terminal domain-containing protein n=1 Tax=Lutimonas saemankumensis TaxID=483016 RepID=UPI001CD4A457|nr:PNGase F N-terminal domain-containing protein [Lutimonas saemankumensis]MCA0932173.1 N-glycanase [Lutimonas saemankumensis]
MNKTLAYSILFLVIPYLIRAQDSFDLNVFRNQPVNYEGITGDDKNAIKIQKGRLVYKKVKVPKYREGSDVNLKLRLKSMGDRWDKSGSCFVVSNPELMSILDTGEDGKEFPIESGVMSRNLGIKSTSEYLPVVELLRFVTPFGAGYYSENNEGHRKPVYIPKWENEIVWEKDISHLLSITEGEFYLGVWIDTWTKEGFEIDLSLHYSGRRDALKQVKPLLNTIGYVKGQNLPEFFADTTLTHTFTIENKIKNAKLYFLTSGHGGHSGGDEFSRKKNQVWLDGKSILDTIPWRDDCASFRRYNPTSGVWLKKDTASYIDFEARKYKVKEIEERIASSDLSRSNWCPGSIVEPYIVKLGDLESGTHQIEIAIDAARAEKEKYNHWLVSAYLIYEE